MSPEEVLGKIREIRSLQNPKLKPSPFLKDVFENEFGETGPVVVRDYQWSGIMNLLQVPDMILGDDTGLGKAQPIDEVVLTPTGWASIGSLRPGDFVIGSDGKPTRIRGVFPQGIKQVYRVTMSDGSSTECCEDHLWRVRTGNTRRSGAGWRTFPLKQIVSKGLLRQRNSNGRRWSIPMMDPVHFLEKNLPVDPYLLGALLGDGSMPGAISVTNGDLKIFDLIESRLPSDCKFGTVKPNSPNSISVSIISNPKGARNSLKRGLVELNLIKKNWTNKFIPAIYLISSISQRIDLLRGLMDTDGYVSKDGKVTQFFSSNWTLVQGFVYLIQSLGGTAKVRSKIPVLRGKSKAKNGRLAYQVMVSLPNSIIPFSLPRKVARWRPRTKYPPIRYIASVEPTRKAECVCISVNADDNLYVTNGFIVTHNTLVLLSALGYIWLKEPEYVPIVVTKKSSLYQWSGEASRFMQGMEAVIIDGEPFERDGLYQDFFDGYDPDRKRLAVTTYDVLLKDMEESVVRDRAERPSAAVRKELKAARQALKAAEEVIQGFKTSFNAAFSDRGHLVREYIRLCLNPSESEPTAEAPEGWKKEDDVLVARASLAKEAVKVATANVERLKDVVAPPKLVPGLFSYIQQMLKDRPDAKFMFVMDEVHQLKNHHGKMHAAAKKLASLAHRKIGMTATPVKNRLMEFFAIFRIIQPGLFPLISHFQDEYCITKLQSIGGNRKVRLVVGHSKAQLEKFVKAVEPYYLSRRKHEVAKELPELITRELSCALSPEQEELYDLAEIGALEAGADPDAEHAELLKAMTMVQQACNAPQLLLDEDGNPFEGASSKLEALTEILQEDPDMKTIVFSRFEKMISLIQQELKRLKIPCVRITGKESKAKDREASKTRFQDAASGVNVILITTAGSESINLHAAEHTVFVDSPWSWGDYVQLTGRNIRIGSVHKAVLATHLIARRRGGAKTIDDYVIKVLRSKKALADVVAGVSLQDGLKFKESDQVMEIFSMLKAGIIIPPGGLKAMPIPGKKALAPRRPGVKKKAESEASSLPLDVPLAKIVELDLTDIF